MSVPFRIRRAEWVAGAMLIFIVTAVIGGLLLMSKGQGSFEARSTDSCSSMATVSPRAAA